MRKNVTDKNTMNEYLDERSSTGDKGDRIIWDEVDIEKDHESSSSLPLEDEREEHLLASISVLFCFKYSQMTFCPSSGLIL